MIYELWETSTGNLIGTYDSEQEALGIVRAAVDADGPSAPDSILLGWEDRGASAFVAEGRALVELALREGCCARIGALLVYATTRDGDWSGRKTGNQVRCDGRGRYANRERLARAP